MRSKAVIVNLVIRSPRASHPRFLGALSLRSVDKLSDCPHVIISKRQSARDKPTVTIPATSPLPPWSSFATGLTTRQPRGAVV